MRGRRARMRAAVAAIPSVFGSNWARFGGTQPVAPTEVLPVSTAPLPTADPIRSLAAVPAHLGKTAKGALIPARKVIAHASSTLGPKQQPEPERPVLTELDLERLQAVQEELRVLARAVRDRRIRRRLNLARECLGEIGRDQRAGGLLPRIPRTRDDSLSRLHKTPATRTHVARNPLNPLSYPAYLRTALSRI